jgi:uroporphyrinogen-III synthase
VTLQGRTILITRPAEESGSLAEQLAARGARAIESPSIEITELEDTAELDQAVRELAAGGFAWVCFTSPRAVDAVLGAMRRHGLPPRLPARIAAIGPATADTLRGAGVEIDLLADPHTTDALADDFPTGQGRVLFPRADIAPDGLEDRFRAKGWTPVRVDAYRTRFPEAPTDEARRALDEEAVDAIVFTSASTVEGFVRQVGARNGPSVVAIGPVTAEAAPAAGFTVADVAVPHTVDGIVRSLENLFS